MNLAAAECMAGGLLESMRPHCVRAEIAGSIRRHKFFDIKDIEIVAVPKWETRKDTSSLFASFNSINLLHEWALTTEHVRWIKPGVSEIVPWTVKPDGKYWRGLVGDVKLDLFIARPENFGLIFLIRTGSAEFSEALVTHAKRIGKRCLGGYLRTAGGDVIETPEESDVFDALNLAYVHPDLRINAQSLKSRPK